MPSPHELSPITSKKTEATLVQPTVEGSHPILVDIEGAERLLNLPKSLIYGLANAGTIPAKRVGRYWRFPVDALRDWANDLTTVESAA